VAQSGFGLWFLQKSIERGRWIALGWATPARRHVKLGLQQGHRLDNASRWSAGNIFLQVNFPQHLERFSGSPDLFE